MWTLWLCRSTYMKMGFNFLLTWEKDTCENASRTIWRLDYNQIWPCSESWALKRVLLRSSIFHVSIKKFLPYTGESKSTFLFLQKKKKIHLSLRKQAWMDDIFLCSKFKHIKEANYLCNMYN